MITLQFRADGLIEVVTEKGERRLCIEAHFSFDGEVPVQSLSEIVGLEVAAAAPGKPGAQPGGYLDDPAPAAAGARTSAQPPRAHGSKKR